MDTDTAIGIVVVAASLTLLVALVVWSRWAVNRIAARNLKSVRDIVKDFENGG